ncbi:transient receptor potential cation channel subfamily M member 3-like [Oppia nitens]|uniref:transient receptor potential cation channel subfamily M member 3-like n=1 Tax=Oppia nitens TaxID=1686743 RepID=UPI0023DB38A4|nr:transient receptor potential cation channel subfamily M member 3-like [Oppia nitens]
MSEEIHELRQMLGEDHTTDASSADTTVRRSNGAFRRIANRLRTAAHWSRARRAVELSEPTLVVDEHRLFSRSESRIDPPVKASVDRQTSSSLADCLFAANERFLLNRGFLHFWRKQRRSEGRPFVRVTHDARVEDVVLVVHGVWSLPVPRIVLVIVSNACPLKEWKNARQLNEFQNGLIKAARSTHMWIMTNGVNTGVSRLIGEAVLREQRERRANIAKAECALNVIAILREDQLNASFEGSSVDLHVDADDAREPNADHSHFVVVKDNTVSKTGINLFMPRLLDFLSSNDCFEENRRLSVDSLSMNSKEIPIVVLVVQGGYDCARLVLDALKRRQAVVVLRGSGGLADVLAFAFQQIEQRLRGQWDAWDPEFVESALKPELALKIVRRFPRLRDQTLARNILRDRVVESVRLGRQLGREYLSVVNLHSPQCRLENLQEYLLLALFRSQSDRNTNASPVTDLLLEDLYLTLDWNCPHVAATEVISRDPTCVLRLEKKMFLEALLRPNREEFIDIFLTHGFRIHKFLSPKRLKQLFKRQLSDEFFRSVCWSGVLGHSPIQRIDKDFVDNDLNWLIESTTDIPNLVSAQTLALNVMGMYWDATPETAERHALAVLTLWSVYANRQQLAKVLWKHSDQPIHLALVVSLAFERLSWYISEHNLKTSLQEPSRLFAERAVGVLDLCFQRDESRAFPLLSEESSDWNGKTAVDLAANARARTFVGHPCVQKWLTTVFMGGLSLREVSLGVVSLWPSLKILLAAIFVFPMYFWVRFDNNSVEEDKEEEEDDRDLPQDPQQQQDPQYSARPPPRTRRTVHWPREILIRRQPPLLEMVCLVWSAPITKFWTFQLFYVTFLGLFSLAVIWPVCGHYTLDTLVCAWTFLILVEHIRRTFVLYRKYTSVPMFFKCIEIIAIALFVLIYTAGRVFDRRVFGVSTYAMKVLLSFALLYFYYRLFAVHLPISPTLGPLLFRLKLMVTVDFVNFMRMALLVICSSGVAIQAVLYPNAPIDMEMLRRAFHRAFFALFITPLDELKENTCYNSTSFFGNPPQPMECGTVTPMSASCPASGLFPLVFSIQYLVFLKLILMTLLYALFSSTASRLQTETDNIWKFQRYLLVIDFAHRLPLPAPLNIFCYLFFTLRSIYRFLCCRCCRSSDQTDSLRRKNGLLSSPETEPYSSGVLSEDDYNLWRHLAQELVRKEEDAAEDLTSMSRQLECVQTVVEETEYEKLLLRQLKTRMREIERLVLGSHVTLERLRRLVERKDDLTTESIEKPHFLSRQSPYSGTRVQRVPVPDKLVAWEVLWVDYDPVAFSKSRTDFPPQIQSHVDEDILLLRELQMESIESKLPVLQWNCRSVNPAGLTIDRTSWTLQPDGQPLLYRLDDAGLPLNPRGRTGLRGRGVLPRWGPNHFVLLIVSRWHASTPSEALEIIVERTERRDQMSLPERFVSDDRLYAELRDLFRADAEWTTSAEMIGFFEAQGGQGGVVRTERVSREYQDCELNSDNAWKETEVWHVHYSGEDLMEMSGRVHWRIVTEDVLTKLSPSQAREIQELTERLKPTIL